MRANVWRFDRADRPNAVSPRQVLGHPGEHAFRNTLRPISKRNGRDAHSGIAAIKTCLTYVSRLFLRLAALLRLLGLRRSLGLLRLTGFLSLCNWHVERLL